MKTVLVLLVCLSAVLAEQCTTNLDCSSTTCGSDSHVVCQHPNPGNGISTDGGLCTCALNDYSCSTQADCRLHWDSLGCISESHAHCYDAKCICTRW